MARNTYINVNVNAGQKQRAEDILQQLSLKLTDAINIFLKAIVILNKLPFDIEDNELRKQAREYVLTVRVNLELKQQLEDVLRSLKLKKTDVINLFIQAVVTQNGLPFDINVIIRQAQQ